MREFQKLEGEIEPHFPRLKAIIHKAIGVMSQSTSPPLFVQQRQ